MEKLWIKGGTPLSGEIAISGSKNATLPLLAACLLASDPVTLYAVPHLSDVTTMLQILRDIGVFLNLNENGTLTTRVESAITPYAPYELTSTIRASIVLLGPLLARWGKAILGLPGGCLIGNRPIDLHLAGLKAMGATIRIENNYIRAHCPGRLKGAFIDMDIVSVTTTQNLMMAASLADGTTCIYKAAREPEVVDLANFLNKLGARIYGAGTDTIRIEGVKTLGGSTHNILSDRLEAATLLIASIITQGHLKLTQIQPSTLENTLNVLKTSGASIHCTEDTIQVSMNSTPEPINIQTAPYPGFSTDLQAQIMIMSVLSNGTSKIKETIFENRFLHVPELCRMGAKIRLVGKTAICEGVPSLSGAFVQAHDLRGCASLILAGLAAQGETVVQFSDYTDRGYEYLEEKLTKLGAKINWLY